MIQEEEKHKNNPTSTVKGESLSRATESTIDGTPALTPDPKGEQLTNTDESVIKIDADEGSKLDDKDKREQGDENDGNLRETEESHPDNIEGSKKLETDLKEEPLDGYEDTPVQLLANAFSYAALPAGIQLPQMVWEQIKEKAPDSIKNLLPEKIEFSPEMQFVGGVVTGKTINTTLHYANDQLSGNNKDKSFLDYYSWKDLNISSTMESFTSAVGKSYIARYTIDLVKLNLEPSAADALTAIMSYCKVAFPMTFAAGLAITTAPPAIELGVNLINTMTSLAGLSSSNDDVDL